MKKQLLFFILCFSLISIYPQNWEKIDTIFSPSGVIVKSFSAPAFADLNDDGDLDLLLGTLGSYADYYENIGTAEYPKFKVDNSILDSVYAAIPYNAAYPSFVDLDADGDYDLTISGYNKILYYENTGTKQMPDFRRVDTAFASVNPLIGTDARQAFVDIDADGDFDLFVGIGESLFGPAPEAGITLAFRNIGDAHNPVWQQDNSLTLNLIDVGLNSYPAFVDIDNDADYDLLIGRDLQTFVYFKNTGTAASPVWTRDFTQFNGIEATNYWKNPTFCDIDNDQDFDLIYGTDDGDILFYENKGTSLAAVFQYNPTFFAVKKVNGSSTVSFGDFDKDGDYDLLSGSTLDNFQYFKNEGDSSRPVFKKTTAAFSSISAGFRCAPLFMDLDGDNDLDIASGVATGGKVTAYINNGTTFAANTSFFTGVQVNYQSVPAMADIDADGDLDILVGSDDQNDTRFYLNDGNNAFTQNTTVFAGISFPRGSRPAFADVDNDNDYDLLVGDSWGELYYYENIGRAGEPTWQRNDTLFAGIEVKQAAHPGFADLDYDGRLDLVIGEYDGNFSYYKNLFAVVTNVNDNTGQLPAQFSLEQNYPNPFNPSTIIRFSIPSGDIKSGVSNVTLKVYDILGNETAVLVNEEKSPGIYEVVFNPASYNLTSGVYFYRLTTNNFSETRKMLFIK